MSTHSFHNLYWSPVYLCMCIFYGRIKIVIGQFCFQFNLEVLKEKKRPFINPPFHHTQVTHLHNYVTKFVPCPPLSTKYLFSLALSLSHLPSNFFFNFFVLKVISLSLPLSLCNSLSFFLCNFYAQESIKKTRQNGPR